MEATIDLRDEGPFKEYRVQMQDYQHQFAGGPKELSPKMIEEEDPQKKKKQSQKRAKILIRPSGLKTEMQTIESARKDKR